MRSRVVSGIAVGSVERAGRSAGRGMVPGRGDRSVGPRGSDYAGIPTGEAVALSTGRACVLTTAPRPGRSRDFERVRTGRVERTRDGAPGRLAGAEIGRAHV